MDAISSSKIIKLNKLVAQFKKDFTSVKFEPSSKDYWSARTQTVYYNPDLPQKQVVFGLLHELAHSQLGHFHYENDFELLRMEASAWKLAQEIGKKYNIKISDRHIQHCLDTYRDWLYMRSHCPSCTSQGSQLDKRTYQCINCSTKWKISSNRFSRPYRKLRRA